MMKLRIVAALLFVYAFFSHAFCQDTVAMRFANFIASSNMQKHLSVLASDEYEGRETGKEGQKKAARYIADHFKSIGLKPAAADYFQKFPLTQSTPQSASISVNGKQYENYKDFYIFPVGKDAKAEAESIMFLGYGISHEKYDDYKDVNVKDKILLVMGGEPITKDSVSLLTGKKELSEWTANFRKKSEWAREMGAAALLVINQNFESNIQSLKHYLESSSLRLDTEKNEKGKEKRKRILQAGISLKMANEILASQNISVEEIKNKIRKKKKTQTLELNLPVTIEIKTRVEEINSENVLGVVEGKEFPEEVIIITAHYDHLGVKNGKVYNGADDDGSGTVAIMQIAEAFAKAKAAGRGPVRSVVFMAVSGEEKGLLGSSYYTDNPLFPLSNTLCNLNIDMIGRGDEAHKNDSNFVYIIGSDRHSSDLHRINESCNSMYTNLKLDYTYNAPDDPNRFYYRSDHYNFAEKGVPIIFYFNGVHDDYHEHTDEIDKINFPLLAKRTRLIFHTAWEIANRPERIKLDGQEKK